MDPKTRVWLILGIALLLLGLVSSLMQEGECVSPKRHVAMPPPQEKVSAPKQGQGFFRPRDLPKDASDGGMIKVDPLRGIRSDEETVEYFQ